ncbi:MAG: SH3 domain-containing protein [Spirochaetaceae bacterium]
MSGSRFLYISFFITVVSIVSLCDVAALEGETVSISVRRAQLRETPSHLAQVKAGLEYTDQVEVLETRGDFYRVSSSEGEGWLHKSSISEETIELKDEGRDAKHTSDEDEVSLAGRGFNKEVEKQYKREEGLNFDRVDRMESRERDDEELREFIKAGSLQLPGES